MKANQGQNRHPWDIFKVKQKMVHRIGSFNEVIVFQSVET